MAMLACARVCLAQAHMCVLGGLMAIGPACVRLLLLAAGTCFGIFYSLKALFTEVHQFKLFAE